MRWDQVSEQLPPGWVWTTVGDIADTQLGKMLSRKSIGGSDPKPYLRNQNVQWGRINLENVATMDFSDTELSKFALRQGDVLICEGGEVGRAAVWPADAPECYFQKALHRARPRRGVLPEYLRFAMEHMARSNWLDPFTSGSTIKHLPQEDLRLLPIPIPPTAEQRRIVDELARRLSHVEAAERGLNLSLRRLEVARDALLLSLLLPPTDSEPDEGQAALRPGWEWSTLGEVADVVGGVTKDAKRQADPAFVDVPYLRVANVQRGFLALDEVSRLRVPKAKAAALRLERGDVLFNEGGDRDKLGRGWVWNGEIPDCVHQNHVFRARLTDDRLEPKFVSWFGNTFGRRWFEAAGKQTTNLASINLTVLKSFPIPVPPPGAALLIVAEAERRLSLIDAAATSVQAGLAKAATLRRSLLSAGFSGQLVSQNSDDTPATSLLAELAAAAAAEKGSTAKPTTRKRKCA